MPRMLRSHPTRRVLGLLAAALALLLLVLGTASSSASGEAAVRSSGPRTKPVVALTFDDGTSPQNCRRILAELVARGVPATFFPMAAAMPLDPAFWRIVGEVGDPVGDHTLTHPRMPALTLAQQEWQIGQARSLARSILGRPVLNVFRPPYGAYDAATLVAAEATGFPIALLWDVDTRDWSRTHTLAQMLAAGELGRPGSVILMHCGPNATPYLVPQLIDFYRSKGFGFVTIPKLLGLAWQPGPVVSISPKTILGGLSPLPPLPPLQSLQPLASGAPSTGPEGPSALPYPSPTAAASAVPTSTPIGTDPDSPSPAVAAPSTPAGPARAEAGLDAGALAPTLFAAALISVVVVLLTPTILRRRRPRAPQ